MGPALQGILRRLRPWIPALLWAVLISGASTDALSSAHTSRFLLPALHWLFPLAGAETLEWAQHIIRKSAHVGEYFIFSVLLLRGMRGGRQGWQLRWAVWALVIAAGYSGLDEYHQSFVPSRGPSPWDSLLDTASAAMAQGILWLWFRLRPGRLPKGRGAEMTGERPVDG